MQILFLILGNKLNKWCKLSKIETTYLKFTISHCFQDWTNVALLKFRFLKVFKWTKEEVRSQFINSIFKQTETIFNENRYLNFFTYCLLLHFLKKFDIFKWS